MCVCVCVCVCVCTFFSQLTISGYLLIQDARRKKKMFPRGERKEGRTGGREGERERERKEGRNSKSKKSLLLAVQ